MIGLLFSMGYSKHELAQLRCCNVFKKINNCHITPLPAHNGHFLLSPRWLLWRGLTVFIFHIGILNPHELNGCFCGTNFDVVFHVSMFPSIAQPHSSTQTTHKPKFLDSFC